MVTERDREMVEWIGRLGAAGAADVMARFGMGRTAAYRRLAALVDAGLLATVRLLYGQPALYVATRDGLAWVRLDRLDPCRVGVGSARHYALCARLAVVLECAEPAYRVWSEREVRVAELEAGGSVASAELAGCRTAGRGCVALTWSSCPTSRTAAGRSRSRSNGGEVGPAVGGDLPGVGALPARRSVRYYARPPLPVPCARRGARPEPTT